jgi:hypothetical protein
MLPSRRESVNERLDHTVLSARSPPRPLSPQWSRRLPTEPHCPARCTQ